MNNGNGSASVGMLDFWRHIFGDETGLLQVWTGIRDKAGSIPPTSIRCLNFNYPKAANDAAKWALEKAGEGREVYFCAHLLTAPQRRKENAAAVLTLWAEYDGAQVPNGELTPTSVVASSPGRFHAYWRLSDPVPPATAENLNKRIAEHTGADPSGHDLTQLLRVPLSRNHKYRERPVVRVVELENGRALAPAELDAMLPSEADQDVPSDNDQDDGVIEPPVALSTAALKVWRGEFPKHKDDGSGAIDRSASLMKIGRVLYNAGATKTAIVGALAERDSTLGWHCYTGRPNAGGEYARIAGKLEGSPRYRAKESRSRSHLYREREDSGIRNPKNNLRAVSFVGRTMPPPRSFVVEGLVPEGQATLVYGASGIAKSFNVLHLGMSVAFVGVEEWHGRRIATMPVIYCDFELDEVEQLRRAKEVVAGAGWPEVPRNFWYVNAVGHPTDAVFDFTVEQVREHGGALVVIDSFAFALAGESEKSSDVMTFMREQVGALQNAGAHVLIVDHVARLIRGERESSQDPFGSIFKKNAARSTIHVTGHKEDGASDVYTTFRQKNSNLGPDAPPFTVVTSFAADEVSFTLHDEVVEPPAPESASDSVVAALEEHGPLTNQQLARILKLNLKTVQNTTKALKDEGVVESTGERRQRALILRLKE